MRSETTRTKTIPARLGAATLEFACAASAFFLLTFGIVEFARVCMLRNVADAVSYEAARSIIIPGADSSDGKETASRLLSSAGVRNFKIEVSPSVIAEGTSEVTVTTTIPISTNSWGASLFFGGKEIKSSMSMLTERNPQEQIRSARLRAHDGDDPGSSSKDDGSDDHDDDEDGGDSSSSSDDSPGDHADGDHDKKKDKDKKGKKNTGKKKKDTPGKDKPGKGKKKGSGGSSKKKGGGSSKSGGGSSSGGGHSI